MTYGLHIDFSIFIHFRLIFISWYGRFFQL